jgi:hypothetical protein
MLHAAAISRCNCPDVRGATNGRIVRAIDSSSPPVAGDRVRRDGLVLPFCYPSIHSCVRIILSFHRIYATAVPPWPRLANTGVLSFYRSDTPPRPTGICLGAIRLPCALAPHRPSDGRADGSETGGRSWR